MPIGTIIFPSIIYKKYRSTITDLTNYTITDQTT